MIPTETDRADEFLDRYRALEEALIKKYGGDERGGSPVVRFINSRESEPWRERLNLCREIRNLLSHHAEFGGERVIQPSDKLIKFLNDVGEYVSRPPLALECSTLFADILKTTPSQKSLTVMKKMERQGFSHVPVIENGGCTGVFSTGTVFSYALINGMDSLRDDMLIRDFGELLYPERHSTERFSFVSKDATISDVRELFERANTRKRLAAVFITDNGSQGGRILGMMTAADLISY